MVPNLVTLIHNQCTNSQFSTQLLCCNHQVVSDSFVTPWTVAHQVPLSMGFPRQEYWSKLPFLFLEDLPDSGIEPVSLALTGRFLSPRHLESPYSIISSLISFSV